MNAMLQKIFNIGIVPVIKITDIETAVPLAKALSKGGIPVAEVTFRTELAPEAIRRMVNEVPDVLTGAGTVLTTAQVDLAIEAGAKFIVTPGFNPQVVDYCISKNIPVLPGAPSTSDIEQAIARGLEVVKLFPAEALGGLPYIKAVCGPYANIKFMPTGGVSAKNINSYLKFNKILACGGSWMVDEKLMAAGDFDAITKLCEEAVNTVLGLEFSHIGINSDDEEGAKKTAQMLCSLMSVPAQETPTVLFVGEGLEVMKKIGKGKNGHIAISCNNLDRAVFQLERRGMTFDHDAKGVDSRGHKYIFMKDEIAGFAIHLTEK